MADRYDIYCDGVKRDTAELRALPPVGATVRFPDGDEVEVVRVVYPLERRVVIECQSPKKQPQAAPKAVEPEAKPETPKAKNLIDTPRNKS